jgi:hypothetical protein
MKKSPKTTEPVPPTAFVMPDTTKLEALLADIPVELWTPPTKRKRKPSPRPSARRSK